MTSEPENIELVLPSDFSVDGGVALQKRLQPYLRVGRPMYLFRKAADPSIGDQFIQLIGSAKLWLPLTAAVTAFFATIGKRAGDAVWEAAKTALKKPDVKPLADVSDALAESMSHTGPQVSLIVGLNIPDPTWGTVYYIEGRDPEEIAYALAQFVSKAEAISSAMQAEVAAGRPPLGRARITFDDGGLVIRWIAQNNQGRCEIRIN